MRITEGLIKSQNEKRQKEIRDKENNSVAFEEDVGDYYMYMDRKPAGFLNDYRGVFDTKDEKALNTAPSIFDRTAIFHTKKNDGEDQQ